ncbi:hypothetical protein [Lysobacter sp. N42]|uniref:hypothetical protein n=1 Tax=Lysobacter sp. N42 TaxID=2545719 RepID=UPI00104A07A0|nr:hypothetical protein [Lysobacter sp. N42]TCZ76781.1 hypothetical protein EYQ95_26155 [Lysobacter sp. N42]
METLKGIGFIVAVIAFGMSLFRRKWFEDEMRRNESHEAPSEHQLKWHIRHLREDIHALVIINYVLLILVAAFLFFKL